MVGRGKTMVEDAAVSQPEGVSEVDVQILQPCVAALMAL